MPASQDEGSHAAAGGPFTVQSHTEAVEGCATRAASPPPPTHRAAASPTIRKEALPWWKRVLVDLDYRATLTELATTCYRQELHLLESNPTLLSTPSPLLPPSSLAQMVCAPSTLSEAAQSTDAPARDWRDVVLGNWRGERRQRARKSFPRGAGTGQTTARQSARKPTLPRAVVAEGFAQHHPKSIQRVAAAAAARRTPPMAALEPTGEAPLPVSETARQSLAPPTGAAAAAAAAAAADNEEDYFADGLAGVQRLMAKLRGTAYRAYTDEGWVAEAMRTQAERRHREQLGRSRTAREGGLVSVPHPPSPTPTPPLTTTTIITTATATNTSTGGGVGGRPASSLAVAGAAARVGANAAAAAVDRWAAPPRTAAEVELDGVLGLSYYWRGALPPSGFIRLAPDPRRAMWGAALTDAEAEQRRRCPTLRATPSPEEQLAEPTEFHRAVRDAFATPLCIHMFQETGKTGSLGARYTYAGTFRQSRLLVHVKVYFRALHEEQHQRRQRQRQHEGGPQRLDATDGSGGRASRGSGAGLAESDAVHMSKSEWTGARALSATTAAPARLSARAGGGSARSSAHTAADPDLLRGVPRVPFPVLRVAAQSQRHDPLSTTAIAAIDKTAAGGRGAAAAVTGSDAIPTGLWVGLTAAPDTQPRETALTAARVWRQLHRHSQRTRAVLHELFRQLPRDAEGCLGKAAYVAFVTDLVNLFFPTHVAPTVHGAIAEEEWVYRGTASNLHFAAFFERLFPFPFIFMRELTTVDEDAYVDFWETVRLAMLKDTAPLEAVLANRHPSKDAEALLRLVRQRRPGEPAPAALSTGQPGSRGPSVACDPRPSAEARAADPTAALKDFTTPQLRLLYVTDYRTTPRPRLRTGRPHTRAPVTSSIGRLSTASVDFDMDGRAVAPRPPAESAAEAAARRRRERLLEMDADAALALAGGLRDDLLTEEVGDAKSLVALVQHSLRYRLRHQRRKAACLEAIAAHEGVTSTWQLHKDGIYDEKRTTENVVVTVGDTDAAPPTAPQRLSLPPLAAAAAVAPTPSPADPPGSADEDDAKLDRLISYAGDICDEVFTENRVRVRERFEAYESLQRERLRRV